MTDRERLLAILKIPIYPHECVDPVEAVADFLLDYGVKVPVTCKDCKFFKPIYKGSTARMCFKHFGLTNAKEHDFCSYGERREPNP